ncbi:membrane cofactor protein-like [Mytilus galloprovincialis]|uniref:membrane cofactor protein-like n=1 Tax=Mytilus galloprovincialis TaxID=29158 RepID=UPI003F7BB408
MNQLIYHSGYHYGDTITFQCVNGYMLSGPPFITCRSNKNQLMGYWSDQQPLCSVVTCHALRQVPHQKLEPVQMKYSYRDNVTIKCNDGYELSPANTMVTCQSDGTWNKKQPNCAENSQFHKDSMENRGKCISYGFYGGSLAAIVSISTGVHVATCFYYRKRVGKPAAVYEDMQFNTVARQRSNNEETYSELT